MHFLMKILFAAGGSIGHIAPCIAVWRAVEKRSPDASAHFVCSTAMDDQTFLQKEGVAFTALSGRRVSLFALPLMLLQAWMMIGREKPDAVFSKGGGVTIPVAIAAWMRGIPIVVHESDAVPGRATRFISKFARSVCYGFQNGSEKLKVKSEKCFPSNIYTGNPVRTDITLGSRERGLNLTGFSGSRPVLLVMGGSQGAQTLNDAVAKHLDELLRSVDIVHITGVGKSGAAEKSGYWTRPFVHDELADLYAITDLALSRAGAGSIGELAANGIPAILVPLEGLAQNHQVKNAEAAARSGGCIILKQAGLDTELVAIVRNLAEHDEIRTAMSAKMRTLHKPDADVAVAKILLAAAAERCGVS